MLRAILGFLPASSSLQTKRLRMRLPEELTLAREPWNEGQGPWSDGGQWQYVSDPIQAVRESDGMLNLPRQRRSDTTEAMDEKLSQMRKRRAEPSCARW